MIKDNEVVDFTKDGVPKERESKKVQEAELKTLTTEEYNELLCKTQFLVEQYALSPNYGSDDFVSPTQSNSNIGAELVEESKKDEEPCSCGTCTCSAGPGEMIDGSTLETFSDTRFVPFVQTLGELSEPIAMLAYGISPPIYPSPLQGTITYTPPEVLSPRSVKNIDTIKRKISDRIESYEDIQPQLNFDNDKLSTEQVLMFQRGKGMGYVEALRWVLSIIEKEGVR